MKEEMKMNCFGGGLISAQESRRKKKEYMDTLERKVEILESERSQYQDHIQNLETTNSSLMAKVQNLRRQLDQLSGGSPAKIARRSLSTQTGVTLPANDRVDGSAKSEVLDVPQQRRVMPLLRKQVNGATVELESS
ncbi:unnamed protein product [Notodromas monacha]|uniref:BZIP domain-containing protein n=1 Tax=Notodromas monacha TaxID=399045 RepID=A0A7R9G8W7_9CRUS|nr:unnamed protein product [Notodromas monacha]CAG0913700.1 unnamed protein product [Notodromas monacha]